MAATKNYIDANKCKSMHFNSYNALPLYRLLYCVSGMQNDEKCKNAYSIVSIISYIIIIYYIIGIFMNLFSGAKNMHFCIDSILAHVSLHFSCIFCILLCNYLIHLTIPQLKNQKV